MGLDVSVDRGGLKSDEGSNLDAFNLTGFGELADHAGRTRQQRRGAVVIEEPKLLRVSSLSPCPGLDLGIWHDDLLWRRYMLHSVRMSPNGHA